eukprot:1942143-Pyramimonas_sp.AAC.1
MPGKRKVTEVAADVPPPCGPAATASPVAHSKGEGKGAHHVGPKQELGEGKAAGPKGPPKRKPK